MSVIRDKTDHKDLRSELKRGFRTPETGVVLLAVLSLIVLFNPLSGEVLAAAPALSFLASLALFMVPGLVLALALLPGPDLTGLARVPAAFVLSAGLFGLAALPELVLGRSLASYLIICGFIIALSLGLAIVRIARRKIPAEGEGCPATDLSAALLWVPFLLLAGVLAWNSMASVPRPGEDAWIYLAYVRDLLGSGRLGGASRAAVNGWLPEQGMLSSISGLDPVPLVLRYLAPTLVVVALLALYALTRTLLKNEKAALTVGSLSALFFLISFGSPSFHSVLAPTKEFVSFITEDKFVARYIFLPVALSLALLFVRSRSWRNLGLFFFVCLSVASIHPLGLVFIGVSAAGFGLVHLATSWRDREAWRGVGGLWLTLLVIIGIPALYLLTTGSPLLSKLQATDPGTAASLIGTWQYERRLLQLGDGSYIAHPSLLLDPAMVAAYLLGVPFLIWKIKRAKDRLAAQLLLGVLAFTPILCFVPYAATFVSYAIGPWLLYRLTWPLLLAALLTLGWMCWEVVRFAGSRLDGLDPTRRVSPFLPLIIVGILLVGAVTPALTGLRAIDEAADDKTTQADTSCLDLTFRWLQSATPAHDKVIMAPRIENRCIKAYVAPVEVLEAREQMDPQAEQDLEDFYDAQTLGPETLRILRDVNYVLLPVRSPLNVQLEHLPGVTRMDNPGERYRMYEVDRDEVAVHENNLEGIFKKPLITANGNFNDGQWDAAIEDYTKALATIEDYTKALKGHPKLSFLAYLGLGRAYAEKGLHAEATKNLEAAIGIDPESSTAHYLLAHAYSATGGKDRARAEFERAIELDPENVDLRLRYGQFLVPVDQQAAIEQYRAVVEMYPNVPDYRVKLGATLLLAGDSRNADKQFERAIYLSPRLTSLWADIGEASLLTGYPEKALEYYEEALAQDPNSQLYALKLGEAHAQLSTPNGGRDEGHFERAETLFESVEDLSHRPWESDQREAARIALGDLYLAWERPEDAATAYERALELNPDSKKAKEKLDGLR